MTSSGARWASLAAAMLIWPAGPADAAATPWAGDAHAAVRLVTASDIAPGAKTLRTGLEFRFAPGWHGYWRTPGDAGLPPVVDWSKSGNVEKADFAWPAPRRLVVEGLQNSVYTGQFVLPTTVRLTSPGAPVDLAASVGFAACAKICVPVSADLSLAVPRGQGTASSEASLIEGALASVPRTPEMAGVSVVKTSVDRRGQDSTLIVDLKSDAEPFQDPDLFVEGAGDGLPPAPIVSLGDGGRTARLSVALPRGPLAEALTLTLIDGPRSAEFGWGAPANAPPPPVTAGWLAMLATALLGGAILNLMPCVLPVLSIKLLALTRHGGQGRRAIRLGFLATALGNVACFLILALVLVGLNLSGASLGWGIQFQQPLFLAAMALVTVLFAAGFFGWLPIGLPDALQRLDAGRSRGPLVEAFLTGMLAALLATPCSAPFVGTAVGFALSQGPGQIVAVFLCLGLGMALPYWIIALAPGLVRWLPKPGAWMLVLRKLLGVVMLGTMAWLLVVLASVAGWAIAATLATLLAMILAHRAWAHHQPAGTASRRDVAITVALSATTLMIALLPVPVSVPARGDAGWQAFDPDVIPASLAEGKTVLVDVTASWCLTCKVNDLAALDHPEVRRRLQATGVVRMRADWSRPDPRIAAYLKGFGRYGIPLDVVYGPRRPDGEALPELLSSTIVLAALESAGPAAALSSASTP